MHNSQVREGLSLFKLLDSTKSPLGTALLKSWFLYPCLNIDVINSRHEAVAFLLQPDQKYLCDQLSLGLRHVKHIPRVLAMMKKKPKPNDWKSLMELSYFGLKMRSHLLEIQLQSEYLVRILDQISANDLRDLGTMMNNYIDFDESESEDRFVVKANVDEELDDMKRAYAGLDDLLSRVARDEVQKVPIIWRKLLNVVYFPQLGYLVSLPLSDYMIETDDYNVESLSFQVHIFG
jgi:DNA mismatch repair protein MSH5